MNTGKTKEAIEKGKALIAEDKDQVKILKVCKEIEINCKLKSRNGEEIIAEPIYEDTLILSMLGNGAKYLIVDEAQFLTKKQVLQLAMICDMHNVDIECYGIRSDSFLQPFKGSAFLFIYADIINVTTAYCELCGNIAMANARKDIYDTQTIRLDKSAYINMCRRCYYECRI